MAGLTSARRATLGWTGLVGLGGMVGVVVRAVPEAVWPPAAGGFPWTTLVINLVGAFVLAGLQQALALSGPDAGVRKGLRLGVGTGVIGGFTTYSTFVLETDRLLGGGSPLAGVLYPLVSLVLGIGAALVGLAAGGAIGHRLDSARGSAAASAEEPREAGQGEAVRLSAASDRGDGGTRR